MQNKKEMEPRFCQTPPRIFVHYVQYYVHIRHTAGHMLCLRF